MGIRDTLVVVEDGEPRIRWSRLATVSVGSLSLAYFNYLIDLIRTVGSGLSSSIDAFVEWSSEIIELVLRIPTSVVIEVWQSNAEFLEFFGALAPIVAVAQLAVFVWILLSAFDRGRGVITGVIP